MTDREERQHVIEVLQNMVDWMQEIDDIATPERIHALFYAIASIKTDLKYDLLYEETSGQADKQADKPTTKNDVPDINVGKIESTTKDYLGVDCISRSDVLKLMQDNWHTHNGDWAMQESMDDIRALPAVTPQEPRKITLEDVKGYCEPRCLTIISNELLYELTHPKIKALEQESASTQEYGLTDADTDKYAVQVQNGEGYYNSFGRYVSYDLD